MQIWRNYVKVRHEFMPAPKLFWTFRLYKHPWIVGNYWMWVINLGPQLTSNTLFVDIWRIVDQTQWSIRLTIAHPLLSLYLSPLSRFRAGFWVTVAEDDHPPPVVNFDDDSFLSAVFKKKDRVLTTKKDLEKVIQKV